MNFRSSRFFYFCLLLSAMLASCNITRKAPKGRPYLGKNSFEVKGGNFNRTERTALIQRLNNQLDDSARTRTTDALFLIHIINRPPAYDTGYSAVSARNMKASMFHIGYYNAVVNYKADTIGRRVNVHYTIEAGKQILITHYFIPFFSRSV